MGEQYLTMAEIEAKYPNQWVLINRPKATRYQQVLGGYVIYHGSDKLALDAVVRELPTPFEIAVEYTGPLVDDDEFLLLNVDWTE